MSLTAMESTGLVPVSHLLSGLLVDAYSPRVALGVAATAILACAVWLALEAHAAR